ncbi:hypothetical protein DERF_002400 [Dermatophagoides farinae]|uniref:Uncharacterized protein n=1 Tax=Dermatophagoides farinae TaxID=6954 RepID=A0A922IGB5_DERFA|nr:hypothetical protein DERF_002400 [Dermatophagoides farinae]
MYEKGLFHSIGKKGKSLKIFNALFSIPAREQALRACPVKGVNFNASCLTVGFYARRVASGLRFGTAGAKANTTGNRPRTNLNGSLRSRSFCCKMNHSLLVNIRASMLRLFTNKLVPLSKPLCGSILRLNMIIDPMFNPSILGIIRLNNRNNLPNDE